MRNEPSEDRSLSHCPPSCIPGWYPPPPPSYQCSSADGTSGLFWGSDCRRWDWELQEDQEAQRAPREKCQEWRGHGILPTLCHLPLPHQNPVGPQSYDSLDPSGTRTVWRGCHKLGQMPGPIKGVLGPPLLQCLFPIQEEQLQGHRGCLWEQGAGASSVLALSTNPPLSPTHLHSGIGQTRCSRSYNVVPIAQTEPDCLGSNPHPAAS
jgi:hypothetical protein